MAKAKKPIESHAPMTGDQSAKQKVLDEALSSIEKQFGKGSIMKLWSNTNIGQVNTFHSGSYMLDTVLWGWYPEWRIVEIYGPESSGKTTIALHAIAEIQKRGEVAAFIDAEHALDPEYARKLWVDTDNLLLAQPDYGEQALSIAEELAKTGAVKIIVIDSVAAMVPRAEVEGEMWASHMGLQARMMSQWLRKLTSILAKTGTTCVFINQIRMKIWVLYGNPETTTWWNALKFYASQRLEIRRWDKIEQEKELIGFVTRITVKKNKVAPPFRKAEIPVLFTEWFYRTGDIVESALAYELITRKWAFYTCGDQKVQGKDNLITYLVNNPEIADELQIDIQNKIKEIRMWKAEAPEVKKEAEEEIEESVVDDIVDEIGKE